MDKNKIKTKQRARRHNKIRAKIRGTKKIPRLSVFKSNAGMYVQLIDDVNGKTLASVHSREIKFKKTDLKENIGRKILIGFELGKLLAKNAKDKKIDRIVFDRGGYKYHGRIKAVADGAHDGGLQF